MNNVILCTKHIFKREPNTCSTKPVKYHAENYLLSLIINLCKKDHVDLKRKKKSQE